MYTSIWLSFKYCESSVWRFALSTLAVKVVLVTKRVLSQVWLLSEEESKESVFNVSSGTLGTLEWYLNGRHRIFTTPASVLFVFCRRYVMVFLHERILQERMVHISPLTRPPVHMEVKRQLILIVIECLSQPSGLRSSKSLETDGPIGITNRALEGMLRQWRTARCGFLRLLENVR